MAGIIVDECEAGRPVDVPCNAIDVRAYTRSAPDKASGNEDCAAVFPVGDVGLVLAVADGLGGMPSGDDASRCAIATLGRQLATAGPEASLRTFIIDAFEEANREILAIGGGAGTTFAVAEIDAGHLRTYHVGDSAIMVVGQRGRMKLETIPHSPVGYGVAAGLIEPEDALHHDDRHFLSNHLGATDMHIELGSPISLATHDTILLATDGVLDNLHLTEIVERIRKGPIDDAARGLAETCTNRMAFEAGDAPRKPDDASFIVARSKHGTPARQGPPGRKEGSA